MKMVESKKSDLICCAIRDLNQESKWFLLWAYLYYYKCKVMEIAHVGFHSKWTPQIASVTNIPTNFIHKCPKQIQIQKFIILLCSILAFQVPMMCSSSCTRTNVISSSFKGCFKEKGHL